MAVTVSLEGKVALVTGGSQGIGEAIVRTLAAAGAHVVVAARNQDKAAGVASAITTAGGSAEALRLDIADTASVTEGMKSLAATHGITVVVAVETVSGIDHVPSAPCPVDEETTTPC